MRQRQIYHVGGQSEHGITGGLFITLLKCALTRGFVA